jgi:probable phosphoglycerate mutase
MTTTRLSFVRHAHAASNEARIIRGERTCTGLTPQGREQAVDLMQRLRRDAAVDPVSAVYSTKLPRARETAEIVARGLGLPVLFVPDLRYPSYGSAEGRAWPEVYAEFTGEHPSLFPHRSIAAGAEPWAVYRESMRAAMNRLVQRHPNAHVWAFGSVENLLAVSELAQCLPVDARSRSKFEFDHTGISTWQLEPAAWSPEGYRWTLLRHNDTGHLPAEQRLRLLRTERKLGS